MNEHPIPNPDNALVDLPTVDKLARAQTSTHKPRILLLYGSTRERSFSRLLTEEAARLLEHFGAQTRIFNPRACRWPMTPRTIIPRSRNCANWCSGPKAWSGARLSATAQ